MPARTSILRRLAAGALLLALPACGDDDSPMDPTPGPGPDDARQVNAYLTDVSNWPDLPDPVPPTPTGESTITRQVMDTVTTFPETGDPEEIYDVEYVCTTTPYTFAQNPEKIVMLSPDRDILWPGSLLQGRSHVIGDGGPGSLQVLPIRQRARIQVSIPSLPTGANFRNVDEVTQANVESAVGEIIGNAVADDLFTPASDDFEVETYNSESEFALKTRLSGRYLRFSGSASADVNRRTSETTIAVRYIQKLFEVVVDPPQTPGEFFNEDFTQERLQEQIDLGRIGPDNQPMYVSNIVYGRMMMFTLTAEASASELTAIVNASYDGLVGGVDASLSTRQRNILSSSRVAISTYGGGRNGTAAMIQSGDWREYFTRDVELSEGLPLSYTFRTLTGEVAQVQEATDYEVQKCQPLGDTPLEYPFDGEAQAVGNPVPTPFESYLGDLTGDGIQDLVLNHLSPNRNVVAVLPGQATGVFAAPVVSEAATTPVGGWANFNLLVGNVDGDANSPDDLVWTNVGLAFADSNRIHVALSPGDGTLDFQDEQVHPVHSWSTGWQPVMADLNGDGRRDLVWNILNSNNYSWIALAGDDGVFDTSPAQSRASVGGWGTYDRFVGDVDRDGDDDLIWNSRRSEQPNRTYVGALGSDDLLTIPAGNDHPTSCCWTGYQRVAGDFDGDLRTDLLFLNRGRIAHRAYSNGFDSWSFPRYLTFVDVGQASWTPFAGDLNGDGVDDIVLNGLGDENRVAVVYGRSNRTFAGLLTQPDHPASATWTGVRRTLVGDVTGEGRDDLVWVVPGANIAVYVGLGRQ